MSHPIKTGPGKESQTRLVADAAWLGGADLTPNVGIEIKDGVLTRVAADVSTRGGDRLRGIVLPGLVNAHSHAFHRLLRGTTHRQGGDFWMWRDRMYEIATALTPESYEEVATAVFIEMAMAGITTVGEFHYLHHQPGGASYADPNEMGHAMARAARRAGIRIALLDVGYFRAGFGDEILSPVQQRFRDRSPDDWLQRVESLRRSYDGAADVRVGLAPHSVRAVSADGLRKAADYPGPGIRIHIHVSEQPAENRDCLEATGMTPTALLEDIGVLTPTTTLVHATHLTAEDIDLIGSAGATVCYCATTERDLADGLGPAAGLRDAGASLCVGSDSHAIVDLFEEMRSVELHQRLMTGRRGLFAPSELLRAGTMSGSHSLGFPTNGLAAGSPADLVVIDPDSPRLTGIDLTGGLDGIVFAASASDVIDVFVGGRRIVSGGLHPAWSDVRQALIRP